MFLLYLQAIIEDVVEVTLEVVEEGIPMAIVVIVAIEDVEAIEEGLYEVILY